MHAHLGLTAWSLLLQIKRLVQRPVASLPRTPQSGSLSVFRKRLLGMARTCATEKHNILVVHKTILGGTFTDMFHHSSLGIFYLPIRGNRQPYHGSISLIRHGVLDRLTTYRQKEANRVLQTLEWFWSIPERMASAIGGWALMKSPPTGW